MKKPTVIAKPDVPQLYDVDAVARRLNVSAKTIRRMIDNGELPVHRIGKLLRISATDLAEYISKRRLIADCT